MAETIGWFVFSGLFQKYPELTVVMTEGFAGWLAFAMQFFDHQWTGRWGSHVRQKSTQPGRPSVNLDALPSYYIKRQAKVTFMWDPVAVENRHVTGTDCLLWGNDYPHVEGSSQTPRRGWTSSSPACPSPRSTPWFDLMLRQFWTRPITATGELQRSGAPTSWGEGSFQGFLLGYRFLELVGRIRGIGGAKGL